jgi:hypothetical protein
MDAHNWNRREIFAIEAETDPSHHIDRVLGHYKRALECKMGILFVVPEKGEEEAIMQGFERHLGKGQQREIPFPRFVSDITREPDAGNVQVLVIPPYSPIMERQATQVDESLKHEGLSETCAEFFKKGAEVLKGGPPKTAPPEIKPPETQPEIQPPKIQPTGETPAPQARPPAQGEVLLLGKRDTTITPTAELGAGKPLYPSEEETRDRTSSEKTEAFEQKYKQGVEKTKRAIKAEVEAQRIEDAYKTAKAIKEFEGLVLRDKDAGGKFEPRGPAPPAPHTEAQPPKTQPLEAKPAETQQIQPSTKPLEVIQTTPPKPVSPKRAKPRTPRGPKLSFNEIRKRVREWNAKGYYFTVRKGWTYACKWDKDAKKMDEQSIGPYDDRVKKLLKRMGIPPRR